MRNKMKLEAKRSGRRHSSMCVINVNGCINRLLNFKNKKGGYKILKTPIYYSGILSCLLVLVMFTFITAGCGKEPGVPIPSQSDTLQPTQDTTYALAGTKWKLTGIVDALTGEMTILEPRDCEQCYTLTFLTDSTAEGFSVVRPIVLNLSLLGTYVIDTFGEPFDGDKFSIALGSPNTNSYLVTSTELRFINSEENYYLLFNSYKSVEQ
jgi:hypothetical protein